MTNHELKNDQLKRMLQQPEAPDLDNAARERIVTSATIRYRHAGRVPETPSPAALGSWWKSAFTPLLAAAAILVLVMAVKVPLPLGGNSKDLIALGNDQYNAAVFGEYQSLFQDELRAVVARNGDVNVVLGGQAVQRSNPLVVIRLEADGNPVFITAYSGQTIETEIGGKSVTLDILTTADQEVVLTSDNFILERGVLHGASEFVAEAHVLQVSL
jgi:hypothetical protein